LLHHGYHQALILGAVIVLAAALASVLLRIGFPHHLTAPVVPAPSTQRPQIRPGQVSKSVGAVRRRDDRVPLGEGASMIKALSKLDVITLFVEDLAASKKFYTEVFGLEVIWEDDASAVVKMSNLIINLLRVSNAPTLIEPVPVAAPGASRALLTIEVDDANAVCAELAAHGVKLLNGPIDRPWGRRTAAFADPAGNTWEIAQVLS
jgi:catechol 2,3-dioxygenase-like lactoylglutathione lyase family enzyme